jgi:hypothetical protein
MKKHIVLALFIALCSVSCAKKQAPYRIEIIDDIPVVHNLRIAQEKAFQDLALAEEITIGEEEGGADYMLNSPVDIDADSEGNIYILDIRDGLVKKYDLAGKFFANLGRKGQGPGEFDRPNQMEIDDSNQIIIADPYQRRFEFLSTDGNYIKSLRMQSYVTSLACGKDGLILVGYGWNESDGSQEYRIGQLDSKTGEVNVFFSQKQYWPARLMNDKLRYDFPYFVRSAIDSQNRIIFGVGIDYEIRFLSNDGELEFKFSKDYDKIQVCAEMLEQITNITLKGPNPYVKNPYFPVFESLSIDENDHVWIQHFRPKWVGQTNEETMYDVFSPAGIFQFTTKLPGHIYGPLEFKNGCIYALRLKDAGFVEAVRFSSR